MMMTEEFNSSNNILGKSVSYPEHFDASLLVGIPRQQKRAEIELSNQHLPFQGEDIWNAYELSWLNQKGKPMVAIGEFRFPCETPNLVESKSFKLYLNSYNQARFETMLSVKNQLINDLSRVSGGSVLVDLIALDEIQTQSFGHLEGDTIDGLDVHIDSYHYQPELLLNITSSEVVSEALNSHLLKSNCLITGQPDWGSIEISYSGKKINREALLKYLISFRQHNEFHEQCVERIWVDIMKFCQPEKLSVYARYTRRGGLDINPFRSNFKNLTDNSRLSRQ